MEVDIPIKLTVIIDYKVLTVWAIWEGIRSAKILEGGPLHNW